MRLSRDKPQVSMALSSFVNPELSSNLAETKVLDLRQDLDLSECLVNPAPALSFFIIPQVCITQSKCFI